MAPDVTADGQLAQAFLSEVGTRVRERRRARGMTVQQLADAADISRRLLTQIEHGQANPSLVAVTRLSRSLGADFTELLPAGAGDGPVEVTGPDAGTPVWSSERGSAAFLLTSTRAPRPVDLWRWLVVPGDAYHAGADPAQSHELIAVLQGELTIDVDGRAYVVPARGSARLRSDRAYAYRNAGGDDCVFLRTVVLAG